MQAELGSDQEHRLDQDEWRSFVGIGVFEMGQEGLLVDDGHLGIHTLEKRVEDLKTHVVQRKMEQALHGEDL